MDHTDLHGNVYTNSQLLNGGYAGRIGVARSFRVSPGDVLKAEAYGKYRNPTTTSVSLDGFAAALTSAFGLHSGLSGDPGTAYNALHAYGTAIAGGLAHHEDALAPKAYLNILLFDKKFNLVDAAYAQLDIDAEQAGVSTKAPHDYLMREVTVTEPGYAYVFVSNENPQQVDVHFDDVMIMHTHSNIVAGADYYPFGLVMDGREIEDEAYRWGYQGQFSEEDEAADWNRFALRNYEPRIGRWLSTDPYGQFHSPYVGLGNTPNMGVDPDGGYFSMFSWQGALVGAVIGAGVGLAFDKDNWGLYALGGAAAGGFLASDFAKVEIWGTHRGLGKAEALYGGGRENIARINHMKLKYRGNFVHHPFLPAAPVRRPLADFKFNYRALPSLVKTPAKPRPPRITSRQITVPIMSSGYSDQGLNEGRGADDVARQLYGVYQRQTQLSLRNVTISFTSTKPTLAVRNYSQQIIKRLKALGVPQKAIIERVVPVKNYGNPSWQGNQLHSNVSGTYIKGN